MEIEKLNNVFDRFYTNTKKVNENFEIQGSGIGLAYSKKLIELHKGSLLIDSKVGIGTTVTIIFPYDKDIKTIHREENSHLVFIKSNQDTVEPLNTTENIDLAEAPKLLLVEDDIELRKYIKSVLNKYYNIDEASNGLIGYEMAQKNEYDLIVSDVMMPKLSGTEMCLKLKSNIKTSHIPIILLTAKNDLNSKLEGYENGADSYIGKPFIPKQLTSVIANLLKTRQHIKEYYSSIEVTKSEPIGISSREKELISRAIKYVEKNIDNVKFNVEELGKELGLSRTHLYRKLKSIAGQSPNEFIRQIRLKKAVELLKTSDFTIAEIAYEVGFKSPANFSTSFKAFYGRTPKEYKL